jgi:hypothetical protein
LNGQLCHALWLKEGLVNPLWQFGVLQGMAALPLNESLSENGILGVAIYNFRFSITHFNHYCRTYEEMNLYMNSLN